MPISQNRTIKFIYILLYISMGLVVAVSSASAREEAAFKVVEVTTTGTITGGNIASAREQAISGGLVSAVALASLDLLPTEAQVENFKALNRILYDQVDTFVRDYKVLTEFVADSQYRVVVQATVMMDRVREQLSISGVILTEKAMPGILIFMAEQKLDDTEPTYWWGANLVFAVPSSEVAMADALREKGFTIVTHGNLDEPLDYDLSLSIGDAVTIGRHLTADIVVVGVSNVQKASNVMGGTIRSYKGYVAVKAYDTETGKEIALVKRAAVAAGEDAGRTGREALANAGVLTGEELSKQILTARQKAASIVPNVEIVVIGTGDLKNFVKFRKMLGTIPGVSGINIKEIKPNESTITVDYGDSGDVLAEALMLKTYASFGIDIYEVTAERLGIELIPE